MAIYETIFILDSLMPPKEIDAAIEQFSNIITSNGGKVRKVDKWGKRRLAYEIQKKQYGFYGSIEFEGPGNIPKLLESEYNFNDKVLRYLTYRYDKRKLKAMAMQEAADEKVTSSVPQEKAPAPAPEKEEKKAPEAEVKEQPQEESKEAQASAEEAPATENKEEEKN